uniref:Uncharacterized protein n=1 Tax=Arundo donax TaxID=35708 RepID=A0A0A9E6N7_ARUDO
MVCPFPRIAGRDNKLCSLIPTPI